MSILLTADKIEKAIGSRELFSDLNFKIHTHERVGLIGPNGSGKSTLLKSLAGIIDIDGGEITTRKGVKLVYLPQVEDIDGELTVLEAAMQASKNDVEEEYERQASAAIILTQIGFVDLEQKVKSISGGWLKRLSIARQLARLPDIMLLDEPTNHLDVEGIEWLETFLKNAKFAYIIISHDRMFLESSTNRIMELNEAFEGGILNFNCAYEEFVQRKEEFITSERSRCESLANKNRREQEWVKAGVQGRGTKQKARKNAAENLSEEVSKLKVQTATPKKIMINFESTDRKTKRLVIARSVCKSYGNKKIINKLDFTIVPGMRIGLLGNNGVGKSTLMKMIAGKEQLDAGNIKIATGCKVLHFDQKRQLVNENETLREALSLSGGDTLIYRDKPIHVSAWARKLKFRGDQLNTPVSALSGGEQARIIMGRLMLQTADVLLLDEPTNDLDIPSIEVLEESLCSFPGAIVLVTHDRAMLSRVSNMLIALDGQGGTEEYSSYEQWKNAQIKTEIPQQITKQTDKIEQNTKKPTKLTYKEQQAWDNMEQNILAAEENLEYLQSNAVSPDDNQGFMDYCAKLGEAQERIDSLYELWSNLEAKVAKFTQKA